MNATVYYEPYRFPAGIMAVAVHGLFFALMYFGFAWQSTPLEVVSVELWQSLPETLEVQQPEKPRALEEIAQPVQQEKAIKPDIVMPEKKKVKAKKAEKKPAKKKVEGALAGSKSGTQKSIGSIREARIAEQKAERELAEQAASRGRMVNEYKAKIQNKITHNIVMPPGVPDDALAIFRVTLLPGGAVLSASMKKSSGNAAYDNAVERAILKSDPLPLPPDATLFREFRVLELKFQPRK